jgi:S-adenosylmethionine:tRNA ribosyltransferase-isomerase
MSTTTRTEIDQFDYPLPDERIARYPVSPRHDSKLLVYRDGEIVSDRYFHLGEHLPENALLIVNNSKVIEARLHFRKASGGQIEVFCLEHGSSYPDVSSAMQQKGTVDWICQVGGAKKWKSGKIELHFSSNGKEETLFAEQLMRKEADFHIRFSWTDASLCFAEILHLAGKIPLPPYLNRETEESDSSTYQTVYAEHDGSVAAPTAGLHLTTALFDELAKKNIRTSSLTLHVGAGTFKPVKSETAEEHDMHAEFIEINRDFIQHLLQQQKSTRVAVGTTSLRSLESLYWMGVKLLHNPKLSLNELQITQWEAYELPQEYRFEEALQALLAQLEKEQCLKFLSKTSIMIKPGYAIRTVDAILTNFHQPRSTLLLLIHAFVGEDWKKIYAYALENDYRFLSYGDGSLLWLKK